MQGFGPGTRISTQFKRELRIIKPIGGGGQGTVYQVDCNGKPMALKWYRQDLFRTPEEKARFEALVARVPVRDEIHLLNEAEFEAHPALLPLAGAFYERDLPYTYADANDWLND